MNFKHLKCQQNYCFYVICHNRDMKGNVAVMRHANWLKPFCYDTDHNQSAIKYCRIPQHNDMNQ